MPPLCSLPACAKNTGPVLLTDAEHNSGSVVKEVGKMLSRPERVKRSLWQSPRSLSGPPGPGPRAPYAGRAEPGVPAVPSGKVLVAQHRLTGAGSPMGVLPRPLWGRAGGQEGAGLGPHLRLAHVA